MPTLNGLQVNKRVLLILAISVTNLKEEIKGNKKIPLAMLLQIILTQLGLGDHLYVHDAYFLKRAKKDNLIEI